MNNSRSFHPTVEATLTRRVRAMRWPSLLLRVVLFATVSPVIALSSPSIDPRADSLITKVLLPEQVDKLMSRIQLISRHASIQDSLVIDGTKRIDNEVLIVNALTFRARRHLVFVTHSQDLPP